MNQETNLETEPVVAEVQAPKEKKHRYWCAKCADFEVFSQKEEKSDKTKQFTKKPQIAKGKKKIQYKIHYQ